MALIPEKGKSMKIWAAEGRLIEQLSYQCGKTGPIIMAECRERLTTKRNIFGSSFLFCITVWQCLHHRSQNNSGFWYFSHTSRKYAIFEFCDCLSSIDSWDFLSFDKYTTNSLTDNTIPSPETAWSTERWNRRNPMSRSWWNLLRRSKRRSRSEASRSIALGSASRGSLLSLGHRKISQQYILWDYRAWPCCGESRAWCDFGEICVKKSRDDLWSGACSSSFPSICFCNRYQLHNTIH